MQVRKQQLNGTWNNRLVPNRKGVLQGCILSPCLFNLYAEYIIRNASLDEAQAVTMIARKISISALLTMPKPLTVDHNKLWKILEEMGIPDHLDCLLRNPYTGQESTVRTIDFQNRKVQIGKGLLSPCLLNLYAEYIV